jgi:hypothetical protein
VDTFFGFNFGAIPRFCCFSWSQSYDFLIYNYNASAVVGYIERFLKYKKLITKRARLLVAL